jgi:glycosyltransferase A (GT-A) superfamily protein (DUF2064 family)
MTDTGDNVHETALILMFKAPARSKKRLQADLGPVGIEVAERLLDCALEDLDGWPGAAFCAAASTADAQWLRQTRRSPYPILMQDDGNLGERIGSINADLAARGHELQLFVGIDCPTIDQSYLAAAANALAKAQIVVGPATDGGAVLLGTRVGWPNLRSLPWSEPGLCAALFELCRKEGLSVSMLPRLRDVDVAADLIASKDDTAADDRPNRLALRRLIDRCLQPTVEHGTVG